MMLTTRPKNYGSFADFERDELRPMHKVGFCVDDLENEATFNVGNEEARSREVEELDFG
jgi:NOL1/NOP2/fmu family ribosome biogenesis protein